jgi:hypothetical protein
MNINISWHFYHANVSHVASHGLSTQHHFDICDRFWIVLSLLYCSSLLWISVTILYCDTSFLSFVFCLFVCFFLCILDYMLVTATDIVSSEFGRCHDNDLKDLFVLGCDPVGTNFPRNSLSLLAPFCFEDRGKLFLCKVGTGTWSDVAWRDVTWHVIAGGSYLRNAILTEWYLQSNLGWKRTEKAPPEGRDPRATQLRLPTLLESRKFFLECSKIVWTGKRETARACGCCVDDT